MMLVHIVGSAIPQVWKTMFNSSIRLAIIPEKDTYSHHVSQTFLSGLLCFLHGDNGFTL
jgi:hypothetical protein